MRPETLLVLIAPNVSQQMGGEALKALQIYQEVKKHHPNTIQITHARNCDEVRRLRLKGVEFVRDTAFSTFLYRTVFLAPLLDVWFSVEAVTLAEKIASKIGCDLVIIHQTEPNSPVLPRGLSARHINIFGPINGNIYYPPSFRENESVSAKVRRSMHMLVQRINRIAPGGLKRADQILVAGGERTLASLLTAGCSPSILRATLDCGIPDALLDRPRISHSGPNWRFVHFGRLVFHKGTALAIRSLAETVGPVCLDIVGRGPELERCRLITKELGLESRVRFLDWYPSHEQLLESLSEYRGMILPSIEDANGIVVQEAMALGLPPICLDWGGPALLIEHLRSGFLVKPTSVEHITKGLASCLNDLGSNGALAESMSINARKVAEGWRWENLATAWLAQYPSVRR